MKRKEWLTIFLSVSLLAASALCAGGAAIRLSHNSDSEVASSSETENTHFNSIEDYSGIQGYRHWYHLTSDSGTLDNLTPMIWDTDMGTWRATDPECLTEKHIVHPGQLIQVIQAWKADEDCSISFASSLQRRPVSLSDGDGIYVSVELDDASLFDQAYGRTDVDFHEIDGSTNLKAGKMIYFIVNCSGNYTNDQTYWNITIQLN